MKARKAHQSVLLHPLVRRVTRFRCRECGKLTVGRVPSGGDGSLRYPSRHRSGGILCEGTWSEAEWVDVEAPNTRAQAVPCDNQPTNPADK